MKIIEKIPQPGNTSASLFKTASLPLAVAVALAAALPQLSFAQQGPGMIEEIMVTAQRRSERSLDVPISITSIGSEWLGKGDVQQLSDIMKLTPGLRFDNQGALAQPTIRGVGTAVSVSGGGSNVAIYTDGFYSPNPFFADTDLLSVESVQVLKGPQGTLFGRNSTGGALLVTTREPDHVPAAEVEVALSKYSTQRYQAYATGGPREDLAFDIAAQWRESNGFIDNVTTGSNDDGGYENWSVRLGAKWDITDRTSATLRYSHSDIDDRTAVTANGFKKGGRIYAAADLYAPGSVATSRDKVSQDFLPAFDAESDILQLTVISELENVTFSSYTQYRRERTSNLMDFDFSALPIYHFGYDTSDDIFTQEFLLSSDSHERLQWTTGLFLFHNDSDWKNILSSLEGGPFVASGNAGSGAEINSAAIFADLTYQLTDNLFLTGGLRVSYDEVKDAYMTQTTVPGGPITHYDVADIDETNVSPRVVLRYTPTDTSSVYFSYTQGYKSPILNVGGTDVAGVEVDSEEIDAFEIGYKYASGAVTFDIAAFYYDYQDLQVATFDGPRSIIENAADSRIYGLDTQLQFAVTDNLSINLGGTYINAEYENFDQAQSWSQCLDLVACGEGFGMFVPEYVSADGNRMQRSPEFTANLGAMWSTEMAGGTLDLSGTLYYTSSFYFDTNETFKQDGYELLSLRAAWTDPSDRYTVALFADNVTDSKYRTQVLPQQLGALSMWGMPATIGASVNLRY